MTRPRRFKAFVYYKTFRYDSGITLSRYDILRPSITDVNSYCITTKAAFPQK